MIKEVIVVEGKDDITAVKRAVSAEVIATNGYGFPHFVKERIRKASETKGIIIKTKRKQTTTKRKKRNYPNESNTNI